MDMGPDALTNALRREIVLPAPPAASSTPAVRPLLPVAVTATSRGERGALVTDDRREEERRQDAPHSLQPVGATMVSAGSYERRLVYEQDVRRVFLDVVSLDDRDERLMRIPPETLARYLDAIAERARATSDLAGKPGIDTVA